jgi:nucleotide-binding universal stress UspA family protein
VKEVAKLLYVTNMKQPSFSEVERLLALRALGLKEVILLHTIRAYDWETRLANQGMRAKTRTVDGPLVPAIVDTAHGEGVSLIAANLNRDRRPFRGSLTTELVKASNLPVLILPQDAQAPGSGESDLFAHLIFATDWSPVSEKALRYLLSLNLETITETLDIVHVIDKKLSVRDISSLQKKLKESRRLFTDHGIDAEPHVYAGRPHEEIMLAARDYDATCIVMGTTGKSAVKNLFSPSCSYRVAEVSVVPTLIIP